jgi:hypothetical protein
VSAKQVEAAQRQIDEQQERLQWQRRVVDGPAARKAAAKAVAMHGRMGLRQVARPAQGEPAIWRHFRLHFRGSWARPDYFVMVIDGKPAVACGFRQLASWERFRHLKWLPAKASLPRGVQLTAPPTRMMQQTEGD